MPILTSPLKVPLIFPKKQPSLWSLDSSREALTNDVLLQKKQKGQWKEGTQRLSPVFSLQPQPLPGTLRSDSEQCRPHLVAH